MASRLLALLLVSPLLLLALGTGHARDPRAQLPKVNVSLPIPREVTDHTDFRGHVEPGERAYAAARVGGEVVSVAFKAGDAVKKGAVLFQIDPRRFKAELDKAEAEVERAQAKLMRATAELTRLKRLVETGAAGKEEADGAAASRVEAEAALKATRAGVELARLNLEHTRVTAPLSGRVGRSAIVAGSVVHAGTDLVTIEATDTVHVAFDVDESTALYLIRGKAGKKAAEVTAQVGLIDEAGLPHRGRVDFSDLRFNPSTGTAQLRVTLPNPDGLFLPGLSAQVRLVEGKPYKAMMVATRAVSSDVQGLYVLVVNAAGVVERRYVKAGRYQGALLPVKEGLKETDQVIVDLGVRGRAGDPAPAVGMTVDPEKVAMPERPLRLESTWEKGASPFEKAKGVRGKKAKGGFDP